MVSPPKSSQATRDGKPTAATARAVCKQQADERKLAGSERTAALVACGAGALRLTRLQRPGRAPLDADAFLRAKIRRP